MTVYILDNGGYSLKVGAATDSSPRIVPNCISKVKSERRRLFIGDQLDDCKDYSSLFYILPFQKGFLVNFEIQKQIWDFTFKSKFNTLCFNDDILILTQPCFNFKTIQENVIEIMFEDYGFGSLFCTNATYLSMTKYMKSEQTNPLCCLVVDSGYSFTHIVPYIKGKKVKSAIRRIDVGGKALTNHLKDIISYRQLHVLDETFVMNQCKEDCCFVSTDYFKDLETCKTKNNHIIRDYVLPDFTVLKRGYVRDPNDSTPITDQQIIKLNNERFQVPEILFNPSDIGINEIGISHAIIHSVESLPEEVRPHMYENILLTGGNSCFQGFKERIYKDVRSMANYLYDVNVHLTENPITDAWLGGQLLATKYNDLLLQMCLTRKDYEQNGLQYSYEKFDV
ncbi:actin-related protein 6-like protein [Dinothrombium tinctorium]|uniref:Actin-related protein 6 n=1 Tax=Dinothrombium tinctorium TaxID=1965070 RepID=A0A3S4QJW5_9ACAR|nr:actin-related protein 6-like protein [Dinothrombium tinctorium]